MKLYKNITISLVSSLLTVMVIYGGFTIYAADPGDFRSNIVVEAFTKYHGDMNDYFNDKIEKLNELMEDDNLQQLLPPATIDVDKDSVETIIEKCGENNVSTYCVSMGALAKYTNYVQYLNSLKGSLDVEALDYLPIINALTNMSERNLNIDQEIRDAEKTMKATLAAYNEYRLAYPMHKKYEEIIKNLVKYKLSLKDIRKRAAQFPIKFIDATSSQCE